MPRYHSFRFGAVSLSSRGPASSALPCRLLNHDGTVTAMREAPMNTPSRGVSAAIPAGPDPRESLRSSRGLGARMSGTNGSHQLAHRRAVDEVLRPAGRVVDERR